MQFLREVTSQSGTNLITGPHKTRTRPDGSPSWNEYWIDFSDDEKVRQAVEAVEANCKGAYFALGTFKKDEQGKLRRRASQCTHLKAFWFDIDCGEEKWLRSEGKGAYRTRALATQAFGAFLTASHMPYPTHIINSGEGLHVYWALTEEIPVDEWRTLALQIKSVCAYYDFKADPSRTADAASVLRIPGTMHKSGKQVKQVHSGNPISVSTIKDWLETQRPLVNSPAFRQQQDILSGLGTRPDYLKEDSETTMDEQEANTPKHFANIIKRSELEGTGCQQIYDMYQNQDKVPEPMWGAALSIAKFCLDGEEWAIKMSQDHPEFDPNATLRKMEQWQAPRTCLWFSEAHPEGCRGCPHLKGSVEKPSQSPIMLASDILSAPIKIMDTIAGAGKGEDAREEFIIPSLPYPFYRDEKVGGIWFMQEGTPQQLFDMDLYIYDRIGFDADNKPRFWARLHTPHDGVSEIELSTDDIFVTPATMVQRLAAHNILIPPSTDAINLNRYLRAAVSNMQRSRPMTMPPIQMGWTSDDNFVIGKWEMTPNGRKMSPVRDTNIARLFSEACDFPRNYSQHIDGWNDCLKKLYGADDAGLYRLILAMGFGTPIRCKYGSEVGGIINIYSEDSGFGKSTLTKVISGIFANQVDPFFYQARQGTTINAFFEVTSYVNSLPITLDETGQLDVEELMLFIHTCTSGKAKARSSHQTNDIRKALPGWRTHVFSSSNVSLWNRVVESRVENEAYLMRVAEVPIRALKQSENKNYGDEAVREIQQYYGVAGPQLIDYILNNKDEIEALWSKVSKDLTTRAGLHGRHRFWGDIMTAAVVGAKVGYDAGVFPFDPKEIFTIAGNTLVEMVKRAGNKAVSDLDLLGELINESMDDCITVASTNAVFANKMPRSKPLMRYEVEEARLYITSKAIKQFAKAKNFGIERLEQALRSVGSPGERMQRVWDNTDFSESGAAMPTWELNLRDPRVRAFLNTGNLTNEVGTTNSSNG